MALAAATAETWGISGTTFLPAYLLLALMRRQGRIVEAVEIGPSQIG